MTTEREWPDETPRLPDGGRPARALDALATMAVLAILIGWIMTACERM